MIQGKVLLVYNPKAGNGLFRISLDRIIGMFQERGLLVVPVRADRSRLLEDVLRSAKAGEFKKVIAAGGDGTLNVVVNAMIRTGVELPLALFPEGTANDFAYNFGIPRTIKGMVSVALEDHYRYVDMGKVNDSHFLNVVAIGSVVDISQKTDQKAKNALGLAAYYLKALTAIPNAKPVPVFLDCEEHKGRENMVAMVVVNGKSAGGFRNLVPDASCQDGYFDVILLRDLAPMEIPELLRDLLQGTHVDNPRVLYFRTKKLRISSDYPLSCDMDGERGPELPVTIENLNRRLLINVPEGQDQPKAEENRGKNDA
ncbi:MAG: YegS/Rv2252/BmrU family lipid kinase [Clostridiales bacterium]|nr:YegS/Rv2252/BmrU family lipid kinase [Clostridiales bacterium]